MSDPAHLGSTPSEVASGPYGHRCEHWRQGIGFGVVHTILEPSPGTGADATHNPPPVTCPFGTSACCGHHIHSAVHAPLPDLDFPKFDGSNPRLWVKQCETFFDIYAVSPHLWVRYASMNLVGSTALWFHTLQTSSSDLTWDAFVPSATNRFDRDEHNHLLRQFFPPYAIIPCH